MSSSHTVPTIRIPTFSATRRAASLSGGMLEQIRMHPGLLQRPGHQAAYRLGGVALAIRLRIGGVAQQDVARGIGRAAEAEGAHRLLAVAGDHDPRPPGEFRGAGPYPVPHQGEHAFHQRWRA